MAVPESLTGGCQCGACRYEIKAPPLFGYVCHCLQCRKHTSSFFSAAIVVPAAAVTVTGPVGVWIRDDDKGSPLEAHFCSQCGVRLIHHAIPRQEVVRVKAGTLDDSDWFVPATELFTEHRPQWVALSIDEEWGQ
jgi:hypothetical protein